MGTTGLSNDLLFIDLTKCSGGMFKTMFNPIGHKRGCRFVKTRKNR